MWQPIQLAAAAVVLCSATRAVCALAEARAHAIAAARTPADRAALLGGDEVQLWMEQLEDRMISIASNAGVFSAGPCCCLLLGGAAGCSVLRLAGLGGLEAPSQFKWWHRAWTQTPRHLPRVLSQTSRLAASY